jgi:prepilin-type N-terminal cleavage/methylation domain-containing protein
MNYKLNNRGFSLTEVLMSVGILAVGMIFIAGVFPVGIHFTTIATERTIAAVLADEAFAKIRLYAEGDPTQNNDDIDLSVLEENELTGFYDVNVFPAAVNIPPCEFAYPSDPNINISRKQYYWSALCRRVGAGRLVQVTVFVSRRVGSHLQYPDPNVGGVVDWPRPVKVGVEDVDGAMNELRIRFRSGAYSDRTFINDGYTIVDDRTGRIYRVLERYADEPDTILLDRDWDEDSPNPDAVWVVPPPVNGSRYPCIGIYQKVIRF